jgi:uncharacterized repeat protein (TIGR01451 family)
LPYGYDAGYNTPFNTDAVASTGGNPFTSYNARLTINPRRLVAPVGQTVVMQGGICGDDGYYIKNQPIEWSISPDSVGQIVEVDRTDQRLFDHWLHRAPIKKSGSYAVGRTSAGSQVLPRDVANPADDVFLNNGQTWVSISSASEGSTHISAVAPTVIGWQERQQKATIHWVDGRWQFPSPAISTYGGGYTLATRVARATDGAPVEGWLVRYEIVGGTPAAFDTNGAQVIEVPTNSRGEAPVTVVPQGEFSGTTQISIEVIRRGRTPGDLPRLPVGQGSTSITWTGSGTPALPLEATPTTPTTPTLPPQPAAVPVLTSRVSGAAVTEVGATATYQFRVENVGTAAAENVEISSVVPPGLRYEASSPEAGVFGDRLRWELGSLEPSMVRSVTVTYRVERDNPIELCATASAATAQDATDCVTTNVRTTQARLDVQIRGDQTANVGDQVQYELLINNLSDRPLTDVVIVVDFDDGLAHAAGLSPIDRNFSGIEPRGVLRQPLNFTVRSEGRRCFRVTTTSAEGARDQREQCVEIAPSRTVAPPTVPTQPQSPPPRFDLPPAPSGAPDLRGQERPREFAPAAGPRPEELELRIRRLGADPGNPNFLIYVVEVWNVGEVNHRDVALSIQTPSGTRFQTSIDPGGVIPARTSPDGRQVDYEPIAELRAGDKITYQVSVAREAGQVGDFLARLTSDRLATPMMVDDRAP